MIEANRVKHLRLTLMAVGLIFIVGIYSLIIIWPSGWSWHSGPSHSLPHYLQMILGVYAALGIFLLVTSRNPLANLSLIWFTVWSSVVHAGIMAAQALANPEHMGYLGGDVPALLVVAAVLALLTPRTAAAESAVRGLGKTPVLKKGIEEVDVDSHTSFLRARTRFIAREDSRSGSRDDQSFFFREKPKRNANGLSGLLGKAKDFAVERIDQYAADAGR